MMGVGTYADYRPEMDFVSAGMMYNIQEVPTLESRFRQGRTFRIQDPILFFLRRMQEELNLSKCKKRD